MKAPASGWRLPGTSCVSIGERSRSRAHPKVEACSSWACPQPLEPPATSLHSPPGTGGVSVAHEFVFTLQDLRRVVPPDRVILDGITLAFLPGAKIGVLGANGAGKSSLLRIMAGLDKDYLGEARPADGLRVGFLPQEPELDPNKDVKGNVEDGVGELRDLLQRFEEVSARFAEPMDDDEMNALLEEQGGLQDKIDAAGAWELERTLEIAMDALRLPPGEADVAKLSGGERRRVALCRLLLQKPDMLLLDEPTNHLDAESVAWLERHLKEYPGTVVAVTHDRYFLDNVAGWILELDRGRGIPYEGNYSGWLRQKQARLESDEKQASVRRRTLERELDWIQMTPRARQTKSKARIRAFSDLRAEEEKRAPESVEILVPPGPRLGDLVVEAEGLKKGYGDRLLFEDLSFSLPRGGIVGVIGANGAGKTTLFRMIAGEEKPDGGTLRLGETVQLAYVDQSRDALGADRGVWEEISGGQERMKVGSREISTRGYVSQFGFKGADQQKKVGTLSGGERNRVHLAKLVASGGNVLLLDEPSNDLDVDTLRALEEGILGFAGCVVVISHDRWFLDRIATHILAFEGDSEVVYFEGNYQDYEADFKRRKGAAADQPHRIKYKKLTT
ncbi:MAG: energy-dependent translational throttle protein EttA [bacterium]|nr:energy-dependent translational throttle protein EttA [bacterium]